MKCSSAGATSPDFMCRGPYDTLLQMDLWVTSMERSTCNSQYTLHSERLLLSDRPIHSSIAIDQSFVDRFPSVAFL